MIDGIAWAATVFLRIRRWSSASGRGDAHRYPLIFGAMMVPIVGGFAGSGSWPRNDLMGNTVFDAIAIFLLIAPGRVLQNRSSTDSLQKPLH
jgi:hypothetical protein